METINENGTDIPRGSSDDWSKQQLHRLNGNIGNAYIWMFCAINHEKIRTLNYFGIFAILFMYNRV